MNNVAKQDTKGNMSLTEAIFIFIKGGLIGVANIIPGVSGGTFALILGVFDRLVGSLNALGGCTSGDNAFLQARPRCPQSLAERARHKTCRL